MRDIWNETFAFVTWLVECNTSNFCGSTFYASTTEEQMLETLASLTDERRGFAPWGTVSWLKLNILFPAGARLSKGSVQFLKKSQQQTLRLIYYAIAFSVLCTWTRWQKAQCVMIPVPSVSAELAATFASGQLQPAHVIPPLSKQCNSAATFSTRTHDPERLSSPNQWTDRYVWYVHKRFLVEALPGLLTEEKQQWHSAPTSPPPPHPFDARITSD